MKIYVVGGAVRDLLLCKIPTDTDYVLVGAEKLDIENMLENGFQQVGNDFPVFIAPITGTEYALARTERKTGVGYSGFETYSDKNVTLEQDLSRRDLTINSMAYPATSKTFGPEVIIDPYGGLEDLKNKVIRHTSKAFIEDPVRVLRVARFMAKFGPEWSVHLQTKELIYQMVEAGELNNLQPDRVWKEMEKAFKEPHPELFFDTLWNLGLFPEYDKLTSVPQPPEHHPEGNAGIHTNMVMQQAVKAGASPEVVFACLCHDFGKVMWFDKGNMHGHESFGVPIVKEFCAKWKVPNKFRDLALVSTEFHGKVHQVMGREGQNWFQPKSIMKLFEDTGAIKDPERFKKFIQVCEADARGRLGFEDREYKNGEYLIDCLKAVLSLDTKSLSLPMKDQGKNGLLIKEAIRVERIRLIKEVMKVWKQEGSNVTS